MDTATPNAAKPKFRRRWFSFSLRTLLIGVTLIGCGLGVLSNRATRQRHAVETITSLGGIVRYDYQDEGRLFVPGFDGPPPGPGWLRTLIGVDYLAKVNEVAFVAPITHSDVVFHALEDLPQLGILVFDEPSVSDSTLEHLPGLTQLKELYLWNTEVTDAGLRHLTSLTHLKKLNVEGTKVTKDGIRELHRALPNLQIDGP